MVKEISFQSYGNRILERLPVCTLSHVEAAFPVRIVCYALALHSIHASLLARLVGAKFARPICQIELAVLRVALLFAMHVACAGSFACILFFLNIFHFQRARTGASLGLLARCGELAAHPMGVERNALTLCFILARLLARRKVSCFAPRQPDLALGCVAFLSGLSLRNSFH